MLDKKAVLHNTDIGALYRDLIPGIQDGRKISSPFREDKEPSFIVYYNTGVWQDFGTGEGGDIINFIEKKMNYTFPEALEYLNDKNTTTINTYKPNRKRAKKKSAMKTFLKFEHQQMIADLQSGKYPEIEKQIIDRKLSKAVLRKFKVGAGILGYKNKDGTFQNHETFVIPFETDDNGELVRYKKIPYKDGKKIGSLIRTKGTVAIFPNDNQKFQNLLICEGELDVLAAESLGLHAVTLTGGAGTFKPEHSDFFVGKDVTLLYDNDNAGIEGQKNAAEILVAKAKSVKLAQWDSDFNGYDMCEFSAAGRTINELSAIFNSAKLYKPLEATVKEIRNENDDKKIVDDFREAVKNKNGGFEEDRAALYLFNEIYRNEAGSLMLCNTDIGSKKVHYIYKNGYWTEINKAEIAERLQTLLNKAELSYRNPNIQSALKLFENYCFVPYEKFNSRYDLINLDNCAYNLHDFTAIPHDSNHYFTFKTKYSYDADAVCPTFEKTMTQWSNDDQSWIDLALEYMGLSLTDNMDTQSFMLLHGPGGRGKGTMLRIIEKLVGNKRTKSNISLKQLKDRFSLVPFIGVTLATCGDLPPIFENIDKVKQLTGQDTQTSDTKFGGEVTFTPMCKMWFSSNTLSKFPSNEPLQPIMRRLQILSFQVHIEILEPDIEKSILKEAPGIFNLAIKGYQRLLKNKKFSVCQPSEKLRQSYTENSLNLLDEFLSNHIIVDPNGKVFTAEIFAYYSEFMDSHSPGGLSNSNEVQNPNSLGKELKQHPKFKQLFDNKTITDGKGGYYPKNSKKRLVTTRYKGIRLISEEDINKIENYDEFEEGGMPF